MQEKIKRLEKESRKLEQNLKVFSQQNEQTFAFSQQFISKLPERPLFNPKILKSKDKRSLAISESASSLDSLLKLFSDQVLDSGINPASGGYMGYIPGGGLTPSAIGDYLADITNIFSGIYFASPGAVALENKIIQWLCKEMGYPSQSGGNLCSGGSLATLSAIVAARDQHDVMNNDVKKHVIYLTVQTHHALIKAIRTAGLQNTVQHKIALDQNYRMDMRALKKQIIADKKAGLKPWLLVGTAGTTDTGAIDPLKEMSALTKKHKMWFHVDGAYGGFFVLTKIGNKKFAGVEQADSIVMDPHKGLFLPYGTGAILVRDQKTLYNSFSYEANYMHDIHSKDEEVSPAELSPELTRHFRGLRLWFPLRIFGVKVFRAALEEKLLLAQYFYGAIKDMKDIEVGPIPDLSIIIFRFNKLGRNDATFNEQLLRKIQADGRTYFSPTLIGGRYFIRIAILSFRTHLKEVKVAIRVLKEMVRR